MLVSLVNTTKWVKQRGEIKVVLMAMATTMDKLMLVMMIMLELPVLMRLLVHPLLQHLLQMILHSLKKLLHLQLLPQRKSLYVESNATDQTLLAREDLDVALLQKT